MPFGVLEHTKGHKVNSITWSPTSQLRVASVSVEANDYYVLSARSLFVTEKHINAFGKWVTVTWVVVVLAIGVGFAVSPKSKKHKR